LMLDTYAWWLHRLPAEVPEVTPLVICSFFSPPAGAGTYHRPDVLRGFFRHALLLLLGVG